MLTKFILHIGDSDYELRKDDLSNWDEIRCSYKRADYDGVVRSFTSQFSFTGTARELLLEAYLANRYNAVASISVSTITNRWKYEEVFRCPLDFSTISWDAYTLSINCIDNSLAALIKANKSTKYEFTVGEDIERDAVFAFERIPMLESVTYGFSQGTSFTDSGDITVTFEKDKLPWVGMLNEEVAVNGAVYFTEDQTDDSDGFLIRADKDITVTMDYDLEWRTDCGFGPGENLAICVQRNGSIVSTDTFALNLGKTNDNKGTKQSPGELPDPTNFSTGDFYVIEGIAWVLVNMGYYNTWKNTMKTPDAYFLSRRRGTVTLELKQGDVVSMTHIGHPNYPTIKIRFTNSKFTFNWQGVGELANIDVFNPGNIATALLRKIAGDTTNVSVAISGHDLRLGNTFLMAAESARGMSEAKFYSSFAEFCDWMSAVFGYVYYIGIPRPSVFKGTKDFGLIYYTPYEYTDVPYSGEVNAENIYFIVQHRRFIYRDTEDDTWHSHWQGCEDYNDPVTDYPRTDTLFRVLNESQSGLYYFKDIESLEPGHSLYPIPYELDELSAGNETQTVCFVHRSEMLNPDADVRKIRNVRDVKYNVDSSMIYSSVTVGYDQKDYGSVNGRDEFNFSNTYTTGCTVTDKTLSLMSKYRADCYGIEFAVQKRGKGTTDSTEDKDVFFVLCSTDGGTLKADKSAVIENSLTGSVFNGAFSPMACVRANAGYIGLQSDTMTLTFASSTGNSSIMIDGEPMSGDITIISPLATCGIVEFTTDEAADMGDMDEVIEVQDCGIVYRGFIMEADIRYAREEATKYKLIVKDIEP